MNDRIRLAFCLIALVSAATPATAENLSGENLQSEIVGQTLSGRRLGMRIQMAYLPDGQVAVTSALFSGRGTWTIAGDQMCVTFESGPREGENCTAFRREGDGVYLTDDGLRLTIAGN